MDLPPGLLAVAPNGAAFLQWTQAGASLAGSITQVWESSPGSAPRPEVVDFTGVLSGASVTLTLQAGQAINGTSYLTGQFDGQQLTLTYPTPDGTIASLVFTPATVADYNAAVVQLEAAAATPTPAPAEFECSVQVLGHDAFVGVNGPLGSLAWNGCLHIVDVVTLPGGNWGPVAAPGDSVPSGDSVVCGGVLENTYQDHVIVFDSGFASFGTAICNALPLTVAFLGVATQAVPGGLQLVTSTDTNGTSVPAVVAGSAASRAGLQAGDILTSLDGVALASTADLTAALAFEDPGASVPLTYLRKGLLTTVSVTLGGVLRGQEP